MFTYIVFIIIIGILFLAIMDNYYKEQIEMQKRQQDKKKKEEIEEQRIKEEIKQQEELLAEQKIQEEIRRQREIEVQSIEELIKYLKDFAERKRLQEIKQQEELAEQERLQEIREQAELQRQYEIKMKFGTTIQDFIKAKRKLDKLKSNEYRADNLGEGDNFLSKLEESISFDYYTKVELIDISNDNNCENNYHLSVDLHGFTLNDVKTFYPKLIEFCSDYHVELTVIHGYNNGTILRDYVRNFSDRNIVSMKHDILNLGITKFIIYNENRIRERQLKEERKEMERKNNIIQLETDIKTLSEKLKSKKITKSDIKKYFSSIKN